MTKEQYEGTPELIFYCEYNPDNFEDRLEIPFTNEYDIKIKFSRELDNRVSIDIDLHPKESTVPKDFFGKNVLNVTAIAGPNGIGKTNIFKNIFHRDKYLNLETIKIFKDVNAFFIEKSEDFKLISDQNIEDLDSADGLNDTSCNVFPDPHNSILFYGLPSSTVYKANRIFEKSSQKFYSESTIYYLLKDVEGDDQAVATQFQNDFGIDVANQELFIKFLSIASLEMIKTYNAELYSYLENIKLNQLNNKIMVHKFLFLLNILEIYLKLAQSPFHTKNVIKSVDLHKSFDEVVNILEEFLLKNSRARSMPSLSNVRVKSDVTVQLWQDFFQGMWGYFNKIIDTAMLSVVDGCLLIDLSNYKYNQSVFELLEDIAVLNDNLEQIDGSPSLIQIALGEYSSGQAKILSFVSSLWYKALNIEGIRDLNGSKEKSIIIIIDEYECHLHPEWMRRFLSYLIKFSKYLYKRAPKISLQFILSTHSPYLISDLLRENIILLEKDEKTGKRTARKSSYGFASNYYDIMSDSFFLDDTIGEFAKQKINQVIKRLNSLSNLLDKKEFRSKKISNKFMQRSQLILDHVNPIIQLIGDPFIKQQLDRMMMSIDERLKVSCQPESKRELLEKQRAILEAQIKQIDQELGND